MDPTVKEHYLEKIPIQIRDLVKNLDDDNTLAIYGALLERDRLGFNEIKELFHANSSQVNRALKSLIAGGLAFRRARNVMDTDENNRVYYEISDLGQKFYDTMFDLVIPSTPIVSQEIFTQNIVIPGQSVSRREGNTIGMTFPSSPAIASAAMLIVERPFQSYMTAKGYSQSVPPTSHKRGVQ